MSTLTADRKDGLTFGGIVSGLITLPRAEVQHLDLRGVGQSQMFALRPGDLAKINYKNKPGSREWFDAAGVNAEVPDLGTEQVTLAFAGRHNAFVNQGLQFNLDSFYNGLTAARITHIGLSADAQAVTAATTSLDPAGGATGTSIKTTANVSRTNQTVHADQTWTQADVAWAITKIGLLKGATAADVANIIGGVAGASPYNEPFTIDLTSIATWSLTMGIDVTATAS